MRFLYFITGVALGALLQDIYQDLWLWMTGVAIMSLMAYCFYETMPPTDDPFFKNQDP